MIITAATLHLHWQVAALNQRVVVLLPLLLLPLISAAGAHVAGYPPAAAIADCVPPAVAADFEVAAVAGAHI